MKLNAAPVFTHIIGWLIFLTLPILFISGQRDATGISDILLSPYYWLFLACYAILFYTHTFIIFPKLYDRKKYIAYGIFILATLIFIILLSPFDRLVGGETRRIPDEMMRRNGPPPDRPFGPPREHFRPRGGRPHIDIVSIILFFLTIALSIAVITVRQLRKSKERALEAETEKAQAELSFLKAQINPHFLFNTLNNIYALASTSHENTAPAILKLSNILRYVTDEISDDFVPLDKEISCIRDYIDLQQLRMGNKTSISFNVTGNTEHHLIPPMVLMTYIENAFKFGISTNQTSEISIDIVADEKQMVFTCRNTVAAPKSNAERTGIGLNNTKQRLDYLYKDKYEISNGIDSGYYNVTLRIKR